MVPRARVYIDGFNLFFGAVKGTNHKWLNPVALSERLLRGHSILKVNYFTARVDDRPDDPDQSQRQDVYLRALYTLPLVEVHLGLFKTRPRRVRLARPRPGGELFDEAMITEEKGTDVALAAHLVWDACHVAETPFDVALVISNDSDLQVPIDMAVKLGISVVVVNPHWHSGQSDHLFGSDVRRLRRAHLEAAQLPPQVFDHLGRMITKPRDWV